MPSDTELPQPKPLFWCGSAKTDLIAFPSLPRARAGKELRKVQFGLMPADFKWVSKWGAGVIEIRIQEEESIFRVVCVVYFPEGIYILHSFQKKTQKTRRHDVEIIQARYRDVTRHRRSEK